jgi:oxygen-independent coproporphyrinogen-3 oxidase
MSSIDLAAQLAGFASRGPRYTSYPPATQLAEIASDAVDRELAALAARGAAVSLYVHVPFCKRLCWYCGCNVIPTRDVERGAGYVDELLAEATQLAVRLGPVPVREIALGGGSPNFLSPPVLRRLFAGLDQRFAFAPDARRSIELDPRSTTSAQIDVLADAGFRSLSMGVQDFAPSVQDAINRHQTTSQTRWLVDRARAAGFDDINIDMVYGLPHQTPASFARTLDAVIELAPDRIALFGYAHLPDRLPHQRLVERSGPLPDGYDRAALLLLAIDQLLAAGYLHLGLDHFARARSRLARAAGEHRMTRTFQGYAEQLADATLGLGVSAISSTADLYWQNHGELAAWQADVAAARLPIARGVALDHDDQLRRAVIGELMCYGEVDLHAIGERYAVDPSAYFAHELATVARLHELASYDRQQQTIRATPTGRLMIRNVCMAFDRYLARGGEAGASVPRFSSTI